MTVLGIDRDYVRDLHAGVTAALVVVVIGGGRVLFATAMSQEYSKDTGAGLDAIAPRPVESTVTRTPSPAPETSLPPLEAIEARKVLRVGFPARRAALCFLQQSGAWWASISSSRTGWRASWASPLPSCPSIAEMAAQLADGYCDLVMSGVAVTTDRAREIFFSDSYLDETVAFVVPDDQREQYTSWDAIRGLGPLTIAVADVPYYVAKLREMLPRASLQVHADIETLFDPAAVHVDALALPAERGSAWT